MEALAGGGEGRIYRFWEGHRKVEYLKVSVAFKQKIGYRSELNTPVRSDDFWSYDLLGERC